MDRVEALWKEAAAWCAAGRTSWRDGSIAPPTALLRDPVAFEAAHGHQAVADEVVLIAQQRRAQLGATSISLEGSRLLLQILGAPVAGLALRAASAKWFDAHDLPPWGAWLAYVPFRTTWALVSHAPTKWLYKIDRAVVLSRAMRWATLEDLRAIDRALPEPAPPRTHPFR